MNLRTLGIVTATLALGAPAAAQDSRDSVWLPRDMAQQVAAALDVQQEMLARASHILAEQTRALQAAGQDWQKQKEALARAREAAKRQQRDGGDRRGFPEFTESFTKLVRLGDAGLFELSNFSGDVTITGGGGNEARIQAVKRVRARNQTDGQTALQDLEIQVTERSGFVRVQTGNSPRNRSAAVDYTIALPSGSTVSVQTFSGNTRISNIKGELRLETMSGDVNISSATRLREFKTFSGNVDLVDVSGDDIVGNITSGDLTARSLKARSLDLSSSSGNIRFADVQSDRVTAKTLSGDIDFSGRLVRRGRYELQSHSGDVRLTPIATAAFDIDAVTFNGDLRSDFNFSVVPVGGNSFQGSRRGSSIRTLHGSVGEGGAIVSVRTFSGDVMIVKR